MRRVTSEEAALYVMLVLIRWPTQMVYCSYALFKVMLGYASIYNVGVNDLFVIFLTENEVYTLTI